ncbi:DNA topoisomerase 1 [Sulfurospirillum diekertiae]|uniref:DNA topoisomerase 1 n=2 Tax=Sulfurospirillum diekertiae TaxID=1854492 RepID=A0A290HT99_9BACT|nr:DNA topoisomerase 1 [Sulfurospirillum diekertiae]
MYFVENDKKYHCSNKACTNTQKACPKCGGFLVKRNRKSDGGEFLGCSNFSKKEYKCKYTENIRIEFP